VQSCHITAGSKFARKKTYGSASKWMSCSQVFRKESSSFHAPAEKGLTHLLINGLNVFTSNSEVSFPTRNATDKRNATNTDRWHADWLNPNAHCVYIDLRATRGVILYASLANPTLCLLCSRAGPYMIQRRFLSRCKRSRLKGDF